MTESQFQIFGKNVENFNKICDLLTVNLRAACEAQMLANDLRSFSKYYAHIDQSDSMRIEGQIINSVNIQMQRINELRNTLQRFSNIDEMNNTI